MLSDSENEDLAQTGHVELKQGVDIEQFLSGQSFEINYDNVKPNEEINVPLEEDIEDFLEAFPDLSLNEEDDIKSTSFEQLALKMENVTEDGKIKKQIKRNGMHSTPSDDASVSILYCSYLEYNDEPVDYAHLKKPYNFQIGTAGIVGLNFAVKSMKVNELAYFIIGPDYAFGEMGHPPRIPPNATFLFRIELLRFSDSIPLLQKLSHEDAKKFPFAFKTALNLMGSAKELIKKNTKQAIRDYNKALNIIEEANLSNMEEQIEQQKLKLRLLTNLAICYNKDGAPKRACTMCNDIYNMIKNTSLKVPAKVYFNNGRALFMIGDYQVAKQRLLTAQKLEPHNAIIAEELAKVKAKIVEQKTAEFKIAKMSLKSNEENDKCFKHSNEESVDKSFKQSVEESVDDSFKQLVVGLCDSLIKSNDTLFTLPSGLTEIERNVAEKEAEKVGLKLVSSNINNNLVLYIVKK